MNARDRRLIGLLTQAWPDATIAHEDRGARAALRITWPDGLWVVVGARSLNPIHDLAPGVRSWSHHEDERNPWTAPDVGAFVAVTEAALERARLRFLFPAPPNHRDVTGTALYGESPRVDCDLVEKVWHGFGPDDPHGFYGWPVWQPEAPIGRSFAGYPADTDCNGPGEPPC